ncbi:MAG TPA: IS256 family transposase [Acidimicrobiales bacterium]|nr:IS256 family transposase [Acidimicrobiales bacterium]
MKKKVPVVTVAEPEEAARLAGLPLEATVALADVAGVVKEGLLGFCADVGLVVMRQLMEAELTARIGPKHAKLADRTANWHGTTTGPAVLGGRKVSVERPRGRTVEGSEVDLDTWAVFSSEDLLNQLVAERMLAGVATRRHADVAEPLGAELDERAKVTSRSSVSRRWKRATEQAMGELMARDLSGLDVAVIMIDGIEIAGQCCVVALVICTHGTKVPVGLWLGDTENKTVVTNLLADLVARGLSADGGLLVVIDGAKALASGVRKVFGDQALVQRCTLHKRRNVKDHLPDELGGSIDWRLARAFNHPDPAKGLDAARRLAGELKADHPDAASSLLEGIEDMFTVRRLGIQGRLALTLTNTNCIESMISVARTAMGRVKRWKDGSMKKRWVAAGMLEAERSFRRVKGCKEMATLVAALRHHAGLPVTAETYDQEAA